MTSKVKLLRSNISRF